MYGLFRCLNDFERTAKTLTEDVQQQEIKLKALKLSGKTDE